VVIIYCQVRSLWFKWSMWPQRVTSEQIFDRYWAQVCNQRVAEGTVQIFFILQSPKNSIIAINCALTKAVTMLCLSIIYVTRLGSKLFDWPSCVSCRILDLLSLSRKAYAFNCLSQDYSQGSTHHWLKMRLPAVPILPVFFWNHYDAAYVPDSCEIAQVFSIIMPTEFFALV